MFTNSLQTSGIVGGVAISGTISRLSEGAVGQSVSIPAAEAGSLTTRTNDTVGTITMDDAGHTIATSDTIDLYWSGGRRFGVTVGAVSGTSVPFSLGSGDNLPAAATAVTLMTQQIIEFTLDGANLKMIEAKLDALGRIGFFESSTEEVSVDLASKEPWFWASDMDIVNPLLSTVIDQIGVTQKSTSSVAFLIGAGYDSTP